MCLLHPGGSSRQSNIPRDLGEVKGWSFVTPSPSGAALTHREYALGICSGEFGGAGSWAQCVAVGHGTSAGCLCWSWWDSVSCWQQTVEGFINGSSMEMCNPDMVASGRIITAPLGRMAGTGEVQGQVGKLSLGD